MSFGRVVIEGLIRPIRSIGIIFGDRRFQPSMMRPFDGGKPNFDLR